MSKFLNFDELMGGKLVKVVYALGMIAMSLALIAGVFGGVLGCVTAFRNGVPGAALAPLAATGAYVVGILLGVCLLRLGCEVLLVIFKMNEALQEIRDLKRAAR